MYQTYLESARREGLETFHLYAANNRISAQELFILYDLRGWMVSFCTVSISRASSSWSNTYELRRKLMRWVQVKWDATRHLLSISLGYFGLGYLQSWKSSLRKQDIYGKKPTSLLHCISLLNSTTVTSPPPPHLPLSMQCWFFELVIARKLMS